MCRNCAREVIDPRGKYYCPIRATRYKNYFIEEWCCPYKIEAEPIVIRPFTAMSAIRFAALEEAS